MMLTSHIARITGPVPYLAPCGSQRHIPLGPCLIEAAPEGASADIVWGAQGQSCVALPWSEVQAAQQSGHLVLLD
jgi:hypothetical protein